MKDLRDFIKALKDAGELNSVSRPVDWYLEAGAIASRANEVGAPAPLFTQIKDYPAGYNLLGSPLAGSRIRKNRPWRRFALAMGLNGELNFWDLVEEYIRRRKHPLKPNLLTWGSCKENIVLGNEIDIFQFPIPFIHQGDGGRYSSWHAFICKDPESDWANWGVYRALVHNSNRIGINLLPGQHGAMLYYLKYEARDQPMPFCLALGGDPLITIAASIPVPAGMNEIELAGGLRRTPIELVKAETNDLYVPAQAEIIIEGEILPHKYWDEGPFKEYHRSRSSSRMPAPVGKITAITYRDNPILPFSASGPPIDDYATVASVSTSAELLAFLRDECGWPVRGVYCPPDCIDHILIISATMMYSHFSRQLAGAVWGNKLGMHYDKIIVCDPDVDPVNREEVLRAIAHKMHPHRGIRVFTHTVSALTSPRSSSSEKEPHSGAQVYFDCTWPVDWDPETEIMKQCSFDRIYPKEIQERVSQRWKTDYGYQRDDYET